MKYIYLQQGIRVQKRLNDIGIPVILIWTMREKAVLQQDFMRTSRGNGQGDGYMI